MTFLPIVQRELRVAARRRGTFWARLSMAALAVGIGGLVSFFAVGVPPQQAGIFVFRVLAGISLGYCLLYGRQATADCLSVEKREGTLGLLFLTDLRGHDVVLGKLAATSLVGLYGLIGIFPVLAVPLLMGGVTNGEFWRMVLLLVNTFLFSLAVGIFVSSLSKDARRAMGANLMLLILVIGVPPAIAGVLAGVSPALPPKPELFLSCPIYTFHLCSDAAFKLNPARYWESLGVIHGVTWALIGLASWIAPRTWQERPRQGTKIGIAQRMRNWSRGKPATRHLYRRRLLDKNAFYWLAARARRKPVQVWIFFGFMAGWWLAGWKSAGSDWLDESVFLVTAFLLNSTLKVWLAIEAGQQLAEERKNGTLEFLLSSPIRVPEILRGQWLALRRQFGVPLLVVLALECFFAMWHFRRGFRDMLWPAGILMLVADIVALGWMAMWQALIAKSHPRATYTTIVRILGLPWMALGLFMAVAIVWTNLGMTTGRITGWQFNLGLWVAFGLTADVGFGLWAWWKLRHKFREVALRQFGPGVSQGYVKPAQTERKTRKNTATIPSPGPTALIPQPAKAPTPRKRRVVWAMGLVLLLGTCVWWFYVRSGPSFPPPTIVSLTHSNSMLRVFPGAMGVFIVLPDGSLWRWGSSTGATPDGSLPVRVGTDTNWVKVVSQGLRTVGIRTDGTLWEWAQQHPQLANPPVQVTDTKAWVDVATCANYAVAVRDDGTLWQWGDRLANPAFGTAVSKTTWPVISQLGTNNDWVAVSALWSSMLALRKDGTLWIWGQIYDPWGGGGMLNQVQEPTQLCRETNWAGFATGITLMIQTTTGEMWEPAGQPPDPEVTAGAVCRLVETNVIAGRFATAYQSGRMLYQIRKDGTLWERACPIRGESASGPTEWRKFGQRSDWVALYGTQATALGVTADGTLWMWGYDPTRTGGANLVASIKRLQAGIGSAFGGRPGTVGMAFSPFIQKTPRPLLRLVEGAP